MGARNPRSGYYFSLRSRSGRRRLALLLIGDQPDLVDTFFAHGVDDLYDLAVTNVHAALDVDDLVFFLLIRERLFDRRLQVVEIRLLLPR